eukprot:g1121.t1
MSGLNSTYVNANAMEVGTTISRVVCAQLSGMEEINTDALTCATTALELVQGSQRGRRMLTTAESYVANVAVETTSQSTHDQIMSEGANATEHNLASELETAFENDGNGNAVATSILVSGGVTITSATPTTTESATTTDAAPATTESATTTDATPATTQGATTTAETTTTTAPPIPLEDETQSNKGSGITGQNIFVLGGVSFVVVCTLVLVLMWFRSSLRTKEAKKKKKLANAKRLKESVGLSCYDPRRVRNVIHALGDIEMELSELDQGISRSPPHEL